MATPKLFSYALLAASALAISSPAMAGLATKKVHYADLDLATPTGQNQLMSRIKKAVKQVCASPRAMTPKDLMDRNLCEKQSMARSKPVAEQTIAAYQENRRLAVRDDTAIVGN